MCLQRDTNSNNNKRPQNGRRWKNVREKNAIPGIINIKLQSEAFSITAAMPSDENLHFAITFSLPLILL